jgi:hypothetical protein
MRTFNKLSACISAILSLSAMRGTAQSGDQNFDLKHRVLDTLFESSSPTTPFLTQMTLRFGDNDTQLVVLTYPIYPVSPHGRAEIISYSITGTGNRRLSEFISDTIAQEPDVTALEIASKLKVSVVRSPVDYAVLEHYLGDLGSIRISPALKSRVATDDFSEYEYSYSTGQESVRYKTTGPFKGTGQDRLIAWMLRFRVGLPHMVKSVKP